MEMFWGTVMRLRLSATVVFFKEKQNFQISDNLFNKIFDPPKKYM